jgi:hypothetical protein
MLAETVLTPLIENCRCRISAMCATAHPES